MTMLFRRPGRPVAGPVAAALLLLGLVLLALRFSAPARAETSSCADAVTSAPTGPATVSAASTAYGRVLVVGSGPYAGCSLYLLTSDQLRSLAGADYACSDGPNVLSAPCDTVLWPALLTDGAPIAGPGIDPALLGTVTRSDLPGLPAVQQVTYAGQPLYRFLFDETPGETEGANLFDPITSPTGTWYLVDPSHGLPAPGQARFALETVGGQTVLAVTMNNDFSVFQNATFPVYTSSGDSGHGSACQAECAAEYWPPVLTSKAPVAGPGVDRSAFGILVRPDGSHQVTYDHKPLYLYSGDAYIGGVTGTQGINGAGLATPWGVFDTIPSS